MTADHRPSAPMTKTKPNRRISMTEIGTGPAPVTPEEFAGLINTAHRAAADAAQSALLHAREAGRLLVEAKAAVGHGKWTGWLRDNVEFSERTARGYMHIAERWPELENRQRVADLSLRSALKLLAEPTNQTPPAYLPEPGHLVEGTAPGPVGTTLRAVINPSTRDGYFHVTVWVDLPDKSSNVSGTRLPVSADGVLITLENEGFPIASATWEAQKAEPAELNWMLYPGRWHRLGELVNMIDAGLEGALPVGIALREIMEEHLYRETHENFEDYCKERWGIEPEILETWWPLSDASAPAPSP